MLTRDPWIRALVIVLVAISGLYLAGLLWQLAAQFSDIILLFFLAWVVAFILEPIVDVLEHRVLLPRPVAVSIAYFGMLVVGATAVIWIVPALSRQAIQLASELPAYVAFVNEHFLELQGALEERGIAVNLATQVQFEELVRRVEALGPPVLANAVTLATQIATFVVQLVLVLMLSFYIMLDGPRIMRGILSVMPVTFREDLVFFVDSVNRAFAGFLRGQLIQALLYSTGTAAIMSAAGLDLILLTAVVNTGLMMIPFIGPPLALVLPLAIVIFEAPSSALLVMILVTTLQAIVVNVVQPRVMSSAVGVHPLLVFVGILAGAKLAGVWGAVFGVPAVAVVAAMAIFYHKMIEERRTRGASSLAPAEPVPPPDLRPATAPHPSAESATPSLPAVGLGPLASPVVGVPPTTPVGSTVPASAPR
ncbi:MAG: AI-2E family transporter [Chloroflexota bacterium]